MLTIRNIFGCRTYWLGGSGNHWEWHCYEDAADGFGPFDSKLVAMEFGRRSGSVV